jgi:hypothetical protein
LEFLEAIVLGVIQRVKDVLISVTAASILAYGGAIRMTEKRRM